MSRTQEIRFGRKTDEIAKFSILDEKTKFTILDEIWMKNTQLIRVIAEKIVNFFHIHWHYRPKLDCRNLRLLPKSSPTPVSHPPLLSNYLEYFCLD